MTLQPREKKLAAVVGALCVVAVFWLGLQWYGDEVRTRQALIDNVEKKIYAKQTQQARARGENARLAVWEERSLPRNIDVATSLYQSWLSATVKRAGLADVNIGRSRLEQLSYVSNRVSSSFATKVPFTLRAKGTVAETTAWLAEFYRADHLHQIADLSLQPTPDGASLQITARIEALALDDAKHADVLSTAAGARVDEARGAELAAAITKRNLFAPYVPPPPPAPPQVVVEAPPPPPPPRDDTAKFTFFNTVVAVDNEPEAWLKVRTTDQTIKLHVGDTITVGMFTGKVLRIVDGEMEIETGGKRCVVARGSSLADAVTLPAAPL